MIKSILVTLIVPWWFRVFPIFWIVSIDYGKPCEEETLELFSQSEAEAEPQVPKGKNKKKEEAEKGGKKKKEKDAKVKKGSKPAEAWLCPLNWVVSLN